MWVFIDGLQSKCINRNIDGRFFDQVHQCEFGEFTIANSAQMRIQMRIQLRNSQLIIVYKLKMNFTFALIAMAAAATANASVSAAVLANAMASVSAAATDINGRRQLDNHEKKNDETQYMKITCVKEYEEKRQGDFLVGDYQLDIYKKADCSDSDVPVRINGTKKTCVGGNMKVSCDHVTLNAITISFYSENSNCTGKGAEIGYAGEAQAILKWTGGDDKCHDPAAEIAPLTKECPAGSKNGAGSKVSRPLSYDRACCDKCEAKTPKLKTCAEVQKRISEGGCYRDCFLALNVKSQPSYIHTFKVEDGKDWDGNILFKNICPSSQKTAECARNGKYTTEAEKASDCVGTGKYTVDATVDWSSSKTNICTYACDGSDEASGPASGANTATVGLASIAILAVIAALGF